MTPGDSTAPPPPVRVLLVDDHPVVRAGLRALLSATGRVDVVGEASGYADAVRLGADLRPDVVLMDLRLGAGPDGVQATAALSGVDPAPRVLVLTTFDTDADILRAVEAGAAGYLLKDTPTDEVVAAVEAAARGETVLAPQVAARLVTHLRAPAPGLSDREVEVLALVADGLTNRAVARRLFVSEATVKSHLVHAFTKLGADSRTGAVAAARARGLLP